MYYEHYLVDVCSSCLIYETQRTRDIDRERESRENFEWETRNSKLEKGAERVIGKQWSEVRVK